MLKSAEGAASFVKSLAKQHFTESLRNLLGSVLLKKSLKKIQKTVDYAEYGGAPLLGLNG